MNIKPWKKYLFYIVSIFCFSYLGLKVTKMYYAQFYQFKESKFIYYSILYIVSYGTIGAILGLEYFMKERKKIGKWTVNISKIVIVGVPSLIFALPLNLLLIDGISVPDIIMKILANDNLMVICNVILGYIIITSLYKAEEKEVNDLNI
ncbi:hypothetical protein CHF27_010710 [Romboutsia maritimum]|uniref:DUF2975 domain-containing protein n=1 Tax=Romboutsia maritimum TaxID=2020948 RepID=A0A371IR62_9FIRM|nr:hypothetical protein [Romboutsia maritimum]RDY22968.1 hypothetical protein CHF27_010710 [Romboutsia maritimum]